jgi:tRNA (mo5U34)-methyltransferase
MKNVLQTFKDRLADPRPPLTHSEKMRAWAREFAASGWWHSFELPDGRRIEGVNPIEGLKRRVALFPIASDLTGKRVLDIGAWDGWFSFEMERRGAQVVAVDCVESRNFREIHRTLGSKIDYRILDVYELTPAVLGYFDIVLFLGVLYHLKHPLLALERVCALTRDLAVVQTFVTTEPGPPVMQFYETDELGGQFDNWVGPNVACVLTWCRMAGFARVEHLNAGTNASVNANDNDAAVACYRH